VQRRDVFDALRWTPARSRWSGWKISARALTLSTAQTFAHVVAGDLDAFFRQLAVSMYLLMTRVIAARRPVEVGAAITLECCW
jgi:hypothetical protein